MADMTTTTNPLLLSLTGSQPRRVHRKLNQDQIDTRARRQAIARLFGAPEDTRGWNAAQVKFGREHDLFSGHQARATLAPRQPSRSGNQAGSMAVAQALDPPTRNQRATQHAQTLAALQMLGFGL